MEARRGSQTPSRSVVLPYETSSGDEACGIYAETGRTAQEWQRLLLTDLMGRNSDGLWTHTKFGYAIPRRNGKNEVVAMRELWGLANGEHILHTAHRTTTSRAAWALPLAREALSRLRGIATDPPMWYDAYAVNGQGLCPVVPPHPTDAGDDGMTNTEMFFGLITVASLALTIYFGMRSR